MKQLTIISGKGGTGKTTIAAAIASLVKNSVFADCDVDAADLHIILKPEVEETQEFYGLKLAARQEELCTECGLCLKHCRFGAIDKDFNIIPDRCEGCAVCEYVCPTDAISLKERQSGLAFISKTRFGPMAHAELFTAEEASGKLVAVVRKNARGLAEKNGCDYVIIDGPPGIGCPVISAIGGTDLVLVVTEPTLSGESDLERVLGVANHFRIPAAVCINKSDINEKSSKRIEKLCRDKGVPLVGKLPYDDVATKAMIEEKSVIEFSNGDFSKAVEAMWESVLNLLK